MHDFRCSVNFRLGIFAPSQQDLESFHLFMVQINFEHQRQVAVIYLQLYCCKISFAALSLLIFCYNQSKKSVYKKFALRQFLSNRYLGKSCYCVNQMATLNSQISLVGPIGRSIDSYDSQVLLVNVICRQVRCIGIILKTYIFDEYN